MIIQKKVTGRVLSLYELCLQKINAKIIKRHPFVFRSWVETAKLLKYEPLKTDVVTKISSIKYHVITPDKHNKLKERLRKMQQNHHALSFFVILMMLVTVLFTFSMVAVTILTKIASLSIFSPLTMDFLMGCLAIIVPLAGVLIVALAALLNSREQAIDQLKSRIDNSTVLYIGDAEAATDSLRALTFLKKQSTSLDETPTELNLSDPFMANV